MIAITQGARANHSGRGAEDVIGHILTAKRWLFERQAPIGRGIYNTPLRADFLVRGVPGYDSGLIIESKWQDTGGSVDEKYPYLVANVKECFPYPAMVVLHGNGCRPGASEWLRRQVGGNLVAVYSMEEFMSWAFRLQQ